MTYEYTCKKCKNMFEIFYRSMKEGIIEEKILKQCPRCKEPTARNSIPSSAPGTILRGPGFAANDLKQEKEYVETLRTLREPLSKTELNELPDIAAEEEKKKGLAPGTILNKGKVPDKKTPKEQMAKKAREQRRKVEEHISRQYDEKKKKKQ